MKEPILVILAAGIGSRYGGLKQIDPVGPNGELLIDYSIYDAVRAGFKRVVCIITPELESDFEALIAHRIRPFVDLSYAYQRLEDLPAGFALPEGRTKPWGTTHAILSARERIDAPFAVINADDYYGPVGYQYVYDFLKNSQATEGTPAQYMLIAYRIERTVTENGSVARGICRLDDTNHLKTIREHLKISVSPEGIFDELPDGERLQIPEGTPVSMNLWGLTPQFLAHAAERFPGFLNTAAKENPLKAEYFLPTAIFEQLAANQSEVTVKFSPDQWYGVTYRVDKPQVVDALAQMHAQKLYPAKLWTQ